MKIVYLHQYFNLPTDGGSSRSYEMAARLARSGHEVHMVTSHRTADGRWPKWTETSVNGFTVHWLPVPYSNKMSTSRRLKAFARFAFRASFRARQLRGDVVFATSTPLTIAIPAIIATTFRSAPMVFEVRDLWPRVPIAMGALTNPVLRLAAELLERSAYRHSRRIVALSPGMREGIAHSGYPLEDVSVIPNAADLALFEGRELDGSDWRRSREWLGDRKMVLYCGTLGRVNDVRYLVEVAAEVRKIDSEVRFVIVGDGIEEQAVRRRAQELGVLQNNVFMLPRIAKTDVPAVFSASDLTVSTVAPVPALVDNSANKFFDSLAAGKPIAINHGGWQADLLRDTGAGVVLPDGDYVGAAREVVSILHDEQRLAASGRAARSLAIDRFARDDLALQLESVLESAIACAAALPGRLTVKGPAMLRHSNLRSTQKGPIS